ncbi:hypothetical protein EV561_110184 [Rhizobium sp. BK376]|jgi:hypothetical protein|nr:hypothetical protein EV561_110184 [Rhizobium sp. BK376]
MVRALLDIILMIAIAIVWVLGLAWATIEIVKALGWIG